MIKLISGSGKDGKDKQSDKNELLSVFARRSAHLHSSGTLDNDHVSNKSSDSQDNNIANADRRPEVEKPTADNSVKDKGKPTFGHQSYNLGPLPFRPSATTTTTSTPGKITTEPEPDRPKPKIAQKPVPAPRQFRSFSKLETTPLTEKQLKNTKSTPSLINKTNPSIADDENDLKEKDKYCLDEVHVKRIANTFQKTIPEKPARKSSPTKVEEESNSKNVLNIVTKINSMTVL